MQAFINPTFDKRGQLMENFLIQIKREKEKGKKSGEEDKKTDCPFQEMVSKSWRSGSLGTVRLIVYKII